VLHDASNEMPAQRPSARAVVVLLLFALVVRGGVLWLKAGSLRSDPDGYRRLAENIYSKRVFGEGFVPTAYRPPLYPLILAAFTREAGLPDATVAGLHLLLGVSTVWLTLSLGVAWKLGRYALLAAALVACDPILLNQSTLMMTETMATFLAAVALVLLTAVVERPSIRIAVCAGLAIALAALCRPTFLVWLLFAPPAVLWLTRGKRAANKPDAPARGDDRTPSLARRASKRWRSDVRMAAVVFGAAVCGLAPWAVRNQIDFGRPIISTTHGGYTLLLGNNPSFYDHLRTARAEPSGARRTSNNPQDANPQVADELRDDRRAYDQARQSIRERPAMFVRACLHRVGRLWGVLPYAIDPRESAASRWLRYATAVWYSLELALATAGTWSLGRKIIQTPWLFGLLLAVGFTAVHAVYWTDLRMRAPLVPFVALLAAAGVAWIASWRRDATV